MHTLTRTPKPQTVFGPSFGIGCGPLAPSPGTLYRLVLRVRSGLIGFTGLVGLTGFLGLQGLEGWA